MEGFFNDKFMAEICKRAGEVVTKKELYDYFYKRIPLLRESLKKLIYKGKQCFYNR